MVQQLSRKQTLIYTIERITYSIFVVELLRYVSVLIGLRLRIH